MFNASEAVFNRCSKKIPQTSTVESFASRYYSLHKKKKFSIKDFFGKCDQNSQFPFRNFALYQNYNDWISPFTLNDVFKEFLTMPLRKKCPNTELFLVRIFCIQSKYRKIRTRNNSVPGQFSRAVCVNLIREKTIERNVI